MDDTRKKKLLIVTYVLTLLYALHYGIPLYATSIYLNQYFGTSIISLLYMVGSIGALLSSIHISQYIHKFHTKTFAIIITIAEIISITLFGATNNPYFLVLFFITHFILQTLLYVILNVFVESFSKQANTGSIRGMFLTLLNVGILISPAIGGFVLEKYSFSILYLLAAFTLIPFLFLVHHFFKHIKQPATHSIDTIGALKKVWKNRNLKAILVTAFIMECFYAVMIIYSSIYLNALGIPLSVYLGVILPFALLPLVLLPYELGYLADKKFGEKEILIGGLCLLAFTTFLFVIVKSSNPLIWIAILITSRIGAACVETMAFTYYFKKINPEDASLTALFSNTRASATIAVGAVGILISPLLVDNPEIIFIILGSVILWCISYVLPLKDTR